jgi:hypothetical protein
MRSKLRTPVLQNLSNFVHKPTPAGSETALQSECCKPHAKVDIAASARLGERIGWWLIVGGTLGYAVIGWLS